MNKRIKVIVFMCMLMLGKNYSFCQAQKLIRHSKESLIGGYQSEREILYIQSNNFFWLKRVKQKNDVIIPKCMDTLAKGKWKIFDNNFLQLNNTNDYKEVVFDIKEENKLSNDSVYIQISLPKDDAFFEGKFEFEFFFSNGIGNYQSSKYFIALPKQKITRSSNYSFSMTIKDAYPNCNPDKKCYQRIYFTVFENLVKPLSFNYFTITLLNFNECFVERMDVDNDLIYFNGKNSILWRGKEYKKVK